MAYNYGAKTPEFISLEDLSERQTTLLMESKTFCMLPWSHLHAFPTGEAYPCCLGEMKHPIGNLRKQTLEEVWNGEPMRDIRTKMLSEQPVPACRKCYEQEDNGFFSMRNSSNRRFGHHIHKVDRTEPDGSVNPMELTYWDIRFSNLCNLKCRSCGHIFSSNWWDDQVKIQEYETGKESADRWKSQYKRIEYAGRTQMDVWEQLEPHIEHVEHIYFAGGEPLIMEEHYRILRALLAKGKNDVRLIYNTNFTELKFKGQSVLELWNQFTSVCVGASLDASGSLGELMRKNTDWDKVCRNREEMLKVAPKVDFYISPTLSVMNVWQLPEFHKDWVSKGYLKHQDLNVNILQDPACFRIDILPLDIKQEIADRYQEHIDWLTPHDSLTRATMGFKGAVSFMMSSDRQDQIPAFWKRTNMLDSIRSESLLEIVPQLRRLM